MNIDIGATSCIVASKFGFMFRLCHLTEDIRLDEKGVLFAISSYEDVRVGRSVRGTIRRYHTKGGFPLLC